MRTIDKKQKNFISFIILATVGVVLLVIVLFSLWTVEETDEEVVMHSESQEVAEKEALEDILLAVMDEYGVTPDQIAISYYNFQEKETYALNEDWVMNAASTTKVATAMLFSDLIWQGVLDWDSELPYSDSYYEEGEGAVTNSEKRATYTIEELVYEMLTYSDNTATNVLALYYMDTIGDYWYDVTQVSGLDVTDPEVTEGNFATTDIMAHTLIQAVENERYATIIGIMREAQADFRLKQFVSNDMAAKYGSFGPYQHDIGIYFEGETPVYVIAVFTENVMNVDEFIGQLNLRLLEWQG